MLWECKCDCGKTVLIQGTRIKNKASKSCGCDAVEKTIKRCTTHNKTHTRLHSIWNSMKSRCNNPNRKCYCYYGGKGIKVCDEWSKDFMSFYNWAISNGYSDELTLDRIDGDKNYSPDNCRWATRHEQRINQKRNKRSDESRLGFVVVPNNYGKQDKEVYPDGI